MSDTIPTDPSLPPALPGLEAPEPVETPAPSPADLIEKFDIDTLTLGEVSMIEDLAKAGIGALADDSAPKGLLLQAIAFVVKRRQNPKYTFAMASMMTFGEIQKIIGDDTPEPRSGDDAPSV